MKKAKQFLIWRIALLALAFALVSGCKDPNTEVKEIIVKEYIEGDIHVYFSPADHCDEKVIAEITKAEKTIDVAVYSYNRLLIGNALIAAKNQGVSVRFMTDKDQAEAASQKNRDKLLAQEGIAVKRVDETRNIYAQMHNKFAIIDEKTVITGSYNWTTNATNNNDENLIIIHRPNVAAEYKQEFDKIWNSTAATTVTLP